MSEFGRWDVSAAEELAKIFAFSFTANLCFRIVRVVNRHNFDACNFLFERHVPAHKLKVQL